ncbi:hypothetical protein HY091_02175 [Candidatus Kaiserbacteria bacterium]|nr:hypothetical protein [Candidatus Kaiserbacteria bacterium]
MPKKKPLVVETLRLRVDLGVVYGGSTQEDVINATGDAILLHTHQYLRGSGHISRAKVFGARRMPYRSRKRRRKA